MESSVDETPTGPSSSGFSSSPRPVRSRNPSVSSERPSTIGGFNLMTPPTSISPEAAFIAASAASRIVTNDHASHVDTWYDEHALEPCVDAAVVTPAALQLVNNFLDQLLLNILAASGSTALAALRPAVSDVLKPKLAKEAVDEADKELREYFGDDVDDDNDDDQELATTTTTTTTTRDWDLELVWRRTRLRCMVYSSHGDVEEEDEDRYFLQGHLAGLGATDLVDSAEVVSPAVAIFLTSIIEFMGEQALEVAGQVAYHRMRRRLEKELRRGLRRPGDVADRIVVEDADMERVALDRTLGRLWRAWKRRIRVSPAIEVAAYGSTSASIGVLGNRSMSRDSLRAGLRHRSSVSDAFPRQWLLSGSGSGSGSGLEPESGLSELAASPDHHLEQRGQQGQQPSDYPGGTEAEDNGNNNNMGTMPLLSSEAPDANVEEGEAGLITNNADTSFPLSYFAYREIDDDEGGDIPRYPRKRAKQSSSPNRPKSLMIHLPNAFSGTTPPTPTTITASQPHTPVLATRKRANSLPTPSASPSYGNGTSVATTPVIAFVHPVETTAAVSKDALPAMEMMIMPSSSSQKSSQELSSPEELSEPADNEPTPKAKRQSKRTSQMPAKINTDIAALALRASSLPPLRAMDANSHNNLLDGLEEPEILTSARVSIGGRSSSPSTSATSELGKATFSMHRSSSVHSARIIDVQGARSPALSRQSSLDPLERKTRPSTLITPRSSSSSHPSSPLIDEQIRKAAADPAAARMTLHHAPAVRTPMSNAVISEVEEEPNPKVVSATALAGNMPAAEAVSSAPAPASLSSFKKQDTPGRNDGDDFVVFRAAHHPPTAAPHKAASSRNQKRERASTVSRPGTHANDLRTQDGHGHVPSVGLGIGIVGQPSSVERQHAHKPSIINEEDVANANISPRSIHTSESSNSSSTGGRLRTVRSSEDAQSIEHVARKLEDLIHSDETIQYTLTPEGMREVDSGSAISIKGRKSEDARGFYGGFSGLAASSRSRSNSAVDLRRNSSSTRPTGLNSHPVIPDLPRSVLKKAAATAGNVSAILDMADFFRSTGPTDPMGQAGQAATLPPRTSSSLSRKLSASISARSKTRLRLQAREAAIDSREDNSDLIDFIRRGPPGSGGGGGGGANNSNSNPRIPRTVAPFRTTADSDQMSSAVGGRAVDAQIPDIRSSQITNTTDYSMPSSTNSQSALLKKPTVSPASMSDNYHPADTAKIAAAVRMSTSISMPKRKTRRVYDPYMIDSDDDNEEDANDEDATASLADSDNLSYPGVGGINSISSRQGRGIAKSAGKEESLAEFLLNYEPPPEPKPKPKPEPAQRLKRPKKKASAPSLIGRFARSSTSVSLPTIGAGSARSDSRSLHSRAGSALRNHIPISVNLPSGYDRYGPVDGRPSMSGADRPQTGASRVTAASRFEPRPAAAATASSSAARTADLAAFLRSTAPPDAVMAVAGSTGPDGNKMHGHAHEHAHGHDVGGFARIFGRKKKSAVV